LAKKVLLVFGTRPEAIKMAPLVHAIQAHPGLDGRVCVTAQHRSMLDQVLDLFEIKPEYDLAIMKPNQDLFDITANCLLGLKGVLKDFEPELVLVHGDTSTTLAAALAAYFQKVAIGHVEAGLRTGDKYSPWPEEMNRSMIGPLVDYHFCPTDRAADNLRKENISSSKIHNTGNTAIDALYWVVEKNLPQPELENLCGDRKVVMMTAHRRENFGEPLKNIFNAVRTFAGEHPDFQIIYPVHLNPNVSELAQSMLSEQSNISLIQPVKYNEMVFLMNRSSFILTDSGGIQEEAPSLKKPTLVLRSTTERPEAIESGCARLVGHDTSDIVKHMNELANESSDLYLSMSHSINPFGDGTAALKIADIIAAN
jgi:UDP-N-acetylglucosamine 2-epimerase (non-hydrolysing)